MEPFVGQISIFAGNYAPRGYALCVGQLMPISGNEALYSLIGTYYGGDGVTSFGIPDFRGRVPVGSGTGPGLRTWTPGMKIGTEFVTLTEDEIPPHRHTLSGSTEPSNEVDPTGMVLGTDSSDTPYLPSAITPQAKSSDAMMPAGGHDSHYNMGPSATVNFIIALVGVYPTRN